MISIIIPSLNVAEYIETCVESVLNQTCTDLEVLCIDGGSSDGTLEKLNQYAAKDARIRIINSDIKSYGYQMNLGIQEAKGDFIGCVEADDYVEPEMFSTMLKAIKESDSEMAKVQGKFYYNSKLDSIYDGIIKPILIDNNEDSVIIAPNRHPELLESDVFLWLGLYRRDLVKDIKFNETLGAAYQDIGFQVQVLSKCKRAIYVDEVFYHYRQDNMSASSFNSNAFKYLYYEYQYAFSFLEGKEDIWMSYLYKKMWNQTYGRMLLMERNGQYWNESESYINDLALHLKKALRKDLLNQFLLGNSSYNKLLKYISGPHRLFDEEMCNVLGIKRALYELIKKTDNEDVIIFGSGHWGKHLGRLLGAGSKARIVAFADNSQDKQGQKIDNIRILSLKGAINEYPNCKCIIANKTHANDMYRQLVSMEFDTERISIYNLGIVHPWIVNDLINS